MTSGKQSHDRLARVDVEGLCASSCGQKDKVHPHSPLSHRLDQWHFGVTNKAMNLKTNKINSITHRCCYQNRASFRKGIFLALWYTSAAWMDTYKQASTKWLLFNDFNRYYCWLAFGSHANVWSRGPQCSYPRIISKDRFSQTSQLGHVTHIHPRCRLRVQTQIVVHFGVCICL